MDGHHNSNRHNRNYDTYYVHMVQAGFMKAFEAICNFLGSSGIRSMNALIVCFGRWEAVDNTFGNTVNVMFIKCRIVSGLSTRSHINVRTLRNSNTLCKNLSVNRHRFRSAQTHMQQTYCWSEKSSIAYMF
jgi:hypothetical protein